MKFIYKILRHQSSIASINHKLSPEFQIGKCRIGWVEIPQSIESALIQTLQEYTSENKGIRNEIAKAQSRILEIANLNNPTIPNSKDEFYVMQYGRNESLAHLVHGFHFYYGACHQIFSQLTRRIPNYSPTSILDMGTGPGTALWAAKHHLPSLSQCIGVDISAEMLEIAGKMHQHQEGLDLQVDWQRQLNQSSKFDLVSCAFTLSEIPSSIARKALIESMWESTSDILILVERGNPFGSNLMNEAREQLRHMQEPMHFVAPCPHEDECPMSWCHFSQRVRLTSTYMSFNPDYSRNYDDIKYSYLIVKKGERPDSSSSSNLVDQTYHWPRMVFKPIKKKQHVVIDLCSPHGEIIRINAAKSHGNEVYKDARKSHWGDLWPHPIQGIPVVRDMKKEKELEELKVKKPVPEFYIKKSKTKKK